MDDKFSFWREFLLFEKEDTESCNISGHTKIEIQESRGKISILVKKNRDNDESPNYKAYLIKCTDDRFIPLNIGDVVFKGLRGELNFEFDARNVCDTSESIFDFNLITIVAEHKNKECQDLICPLKAFRGEKTEWRRQFEEYINPVRVISEVFPRVNEQEPSCSNERREAYFQYDQFCEREESVQEEVDRSEEINKYTLDVSNLLYDFSKYFQSDAPFKSARKDYSWWRVSIPICLSNILYKFGIDSRILFDLNVITAYSTYRHLLIGIYKSPKDKNYLVFGIPGLKNEMCYDGLGTWVRSDNVPGENAGYWLVYFTL